MPKQYFEPFALERIQIPTGYKADDLDDLPPAGQRPARNRFFAHIQKHEQWQKGIRDLARPATTPRARVAETEQKVISLVSGEVISALLA